MRLLIIEDDIDTKDFLKNSLEGEGFVVDVAEDGQKGSYMARTNEYDLIILDNILPKKLGIDVCQEIKTSKKNQRIILLSAKTELNERIRFLNDGADDYVTKPFSFLELLARIRAILRRPKPIDEDILTIGDLTLDRNTQRAKRGTSPIYLTRKEFMLLEQLMRQKGNFVSRGAIMEHVWDASLDPFSNTIETHIMNLRRKIDGTKKKRLIHTVPGRGYKIDIHNDEN
jgi:two-component system copper resistance phosphate regulon response regulator CusR